jgi:hypothetical protein
MDGRQEGDGERPTSNFERPTLKNLILLNVEWEILGGRP